MSKEKGAIYLWFMDYFNNKKNMYEHNITVRSMLDKLFTNENAKKMLDITSENIKEIDFDKHIANKDVVIINIKPSYYGPATNILEALFFHSYQSAVLRQNERKCISNFLYIDDCYFSLKDMINQFMLLCDGRKYKVGILVTLQNFSLLDEEFDKDLLLCNLRNLILMPGFSMSDAKIFTEILINFSFTDVLYMNFGEILYSIIDNNVKGYLNTDIGYVKSISEDERDFFYRRILAYKMQSINKGK